MQGTGIYTGSPLKTKAPSHVQPARESDDKKERKWGRQGTKYLGSGTLEFQQDQGTGTLHDVEIKQEGLVPGSAEGKQSRLLNHPI
jgi:hypothetical protein